MLKRLVSVLSTMVVLICLFPLVVSADGTASFSAASIRIENTSGMYAETEDNGSRSKANCLERDFQAITGWIGKDDKYDFFKFTLDDNCFLTMDAVSVQTGAKTTKFRLCNSSGKVLKTAVYAGLNHNDDAYVLSYSLSPGTYYFRVTESNPDAYRPYVFWFRLKYQLDTPKTTGITDAATGKPVISWNTIEDARYYNVYRAESRSGEYTCVARNVYETSFTDSDTIPGKTYYYKIKAFSRNEKIYRSQSSPEVAVICDCARPEIWLTHRSTTGKNIVKWNAIEGAARYRVYCATSETGTYKHLGTTSKLYFIHSSGASNKMYYYKVRAVSEVRTSANSAYSAVVGQRTK